MKRFFGLLLALVLVVPFVCFRGEAATATYGSCGENMTWRFESETGTLVISGSGSMYKFTESSDTGSFSVAPWRSLPIKAVRVGENVTGLCSYFCYGQDELVDVSLPENLSGLPGDAFAYCTALKEVELPENLHNLGGGAFKGCTALETIDLSNVTYFGSEAFEGCTGLKSVIMPETADTLGSCVFMDCTALTEIPIPSGLTTIGNSAFSGTNLRTVTVPEGVTRISSSAFSDMPYLHTVTLPLSLKEIDIYAFHNCPSLRDVHYPGTGEQMGEISIHSYNEPLKEAQWHFIGVDAPQISIRETGETSVTLDWEPVEGAEYYEVWHNAADPNLLGVFTYSCIGSTEDTEFTHLEAVPEKKNRYRVKAYDLETDSWSAFSNVPVWFCQVQRPTGNVCGDDMTWSFDEATGLLTISGSGKMYDYLSIDENNKVICVSPWGELPLTAVVVDSGVTGIGDGAFMDCPSLQSVQLPDSVEEIGKYTFTNCTELTDVKLPARVDSFNMERAFQNCTALETIELPSGLVSIGNYAFNACKSLTEFAIPDTVTSLGSGVFYGCEKLTSIAIPQTIELIPANCFRSCTALKTVKLPRSTTKVDSSAFFACDSLTDVYYGGTPAERNSITFSGQNLELENAIWHYTYSARLPAPEITIANNNDGHIQVKLEKDTAVSYCEISMATAPEGPYTVVTKKTLSTKYAVKNLEIGVKYYFRVRALETDSFAGSDYSNVASGYRKLVMGTLSLSMPCSGENILSWNPVEQAVGYEIWRGVYGVSGNMEKVAQTAETTFADTTADEETSYYYRLVALHQQPESNSALSGYIYALVDRRPEHDYGEWERVREPSVQASGEERRTCSTCGGVETRTLEALGLAAPVVKISGNTVTGKPKLSWEAVSGADFYRIYRAVGSTGSYSYYKSTRTTSFTDTSAVAGTNYYYKIKAVVEETDETSAYSNIVNRCCDLAKPVVTLKVDTASGKPKVTFEKISGAEKYYIVRSTSRTGTYSKLATITGTSYIDTSAKAGTNYYYKVKALHAKDAADSAYSDITNRVCDLAKPTVSISYNSTSGKPVVKWNTVEGAAKYRVYRSTSRDSGYELVYTAVTARTYTDTAAKAGTNYYYKVKAVHTNSSADSAYSAIVNRVCDLAKPVVSITRSNGDPKVSWETVEGAEKYEIWRATSKSGEYKKVKTAITARSFTDTNVTAGKTYYYKVRAIHAKEAANSAYSSVKYITAK